MLNTAAYEAADRQRTGEQEAAHDIRTHTHPTPRPRPAPSDPARMPAMTRDTKLALILGFALLLIVGLVISDHFAEGPDELIATPGTTLAGATPITRPGDTGETIPLPTSRTPLDRAVATPEIILDGNPSGTTRPDGIETIRPGWVTRALDEARKLQAPPTAAAIDEHTTRGAKGDGDTEPPVLVTPKRQQVREHVVQPGETLWAIAERYYGDGFLHTQLAAANASVVSADGQLARGVTLRIPPRAALAEKPNAPEPSSSPTPARTGEIVAYTVQQGDVLGTISAKLLGTSRRWQEILELNRDKLDAPEDLRAGMVLVIPAD